MRLEDAFLRGLHPGRGSGVPPWGLLIDRRGIHYDAASPSALEDLLASHPLDDPLLLSRAADALARLKRLGGKFTFHDPDAALPPEGHVLVVDQRRGDASVAASGASRRSFLAMLSAARDRFPGHVLAVRAAPDGHLLPGDLRRGELYLTGPASPWPLLERAHAVLSVSSQMGAEAIWAGHRPLLFGTPVHAGWGLSEDPAPLPRRTRTLSPLQLFAGMMLLAPHWYDPFRDRLCDFETVLELAEAETAAAIADRHGYAAWGMSLWKRRHLARSFGGDVRFPLTARGLRRQAGTRPVLAWASRPAPDLTGTIRVEDGFLRSRGLGARLVPPVSLIADAQGIYYDPARPSDLEGMIADSRFLPPVALDRAARLRRSVAASGATKYGQGGTRPPLPGGRLVLVAGQVEDDASIRCGATGTVRSNAALLQAARAAEPGAVLIYRPHPDVTAGLRPGALAPDEAALADLVLGDADPAWLLGEVSALWTITSLMGFEALLRGVPVTCLGAPFYAGWGLTRDLAPVPTRRRVSGVALDGLVHAALIGAPRYRDPVTGRICTAEVALERLAAMPADTRGPVARLAAKAQGLWATLHPRRC